MKSKTTNSTVKIVNSAGQGLGAETRETTKIEAETLACTERKSRPTAQPARATETPSPRVNP